MGIMSEQVPAFRTICATQRPLAFRHAVGTASKPFQDRPVPPPSSNPHSILMVEKWRQTMSNTNIIEHTSSCAELHDEQTPAPHMPFAPAKHTNPMRDVQAHRRNTRKGQHGRTSQTPSHRKDETATEEMRPQDGQRDTRNSDYSSGGPDCSASSHNRKATTRIFYDPLLGNHHIPAVKASDLMEQIVEDANFLQAVAAVGKEPDKAPGYDHRSVGDVCRWLYSDSSAREEIRQQLLQGKYRPDKVRTVQKPKPNGKMRTLGIATVQDRIVQTMILQVIKTHLPKETWNPHSYAYLPQSDIADAIAEVNRIRKEGYRYGIALDLKSFFDNVPHDRLMYQLKRHIDDKRVVGLVNAFLTPLIIGRRNELTKNRAGTPQGSVLSPWLASMLYLDELDQELERRGLRFVRYADDVTVFSFSWKAAKRIKARLIDFLENTMKCPVNKDKTKVVKIGELSLFGVYLDHEKWRIERNKEREACATYLAGLHKYSETGKVLHLRKAAERMSGFVNHYVRIPGMARDEVPALKRWCRNRWKAIAGRKLLFDQTWFLIRYRPRELTTAQSV